MCIRDRCWRVRASSPSAILSSPSTTAASGAARFWRCSRGEPRVNSSRPQNCTLSARLRSPAARRGAAARTLLERRPKIVRTKPSPRSYPASAALLRLSRPGEHAAPFPLTACPPPPRPPQWPVDAVVHRLH
eukprot:6878796-Prymnesium_polylepis.2